VQYCMLIGAYITDHRGSSLKNIVNVAAKQTVNF
jgi:hypothetical protein